MAKNLDGIKKLNPEEIRKNRKIVLSYIGEKDKDSELIKKPKTVSRIVSVFNKVDGIKLNKIFSAKPKVNNLTEKPELAIGNRAGKQERINLEKERAKQIKIEREEFVKKEIAEKVRREAEEKLKAEEIIKKIKEKELMEKELAQKSKIEALEKAKAEEARKWQEKLRLEEKAREEKRFMKENERLAKIEAARKRKLKRQKAMKLFKENLSNKLGEIFSIVKKNFVYGALYLITFLIISYAVFCLLVLRFKIDDNIIGEMARILPVPAVVTSQGIISYYDFRDITKDINYSYLNPAERKNSFAKWIIIKNLSKKYGLPVNSPSEDLAFAADEDFNQVGLLRIKKISELLKNVDDLKSLNKYADEYSDVIYYNSENAAKKFGQAVFNLDINQVSDIIIRNNGYYIVQIIDNKDGQLGIKYLFVEAKTLERYVNEESSEIKIFILAN